MNDTGEGNSPSPSPFLASVVFLSPVSDPDHHYYQHLVPKMTDNPVVSDAVPPESGEIAGQRLATHAWVIETPDLLQVGNDAFLPDAIDLAQRLHGCRVELNAPDQGLA